MNPVLLFPGQSSRRAGMLTAAEALAPAACGAVLDTACDVLRRDLRTWDALPGHLAFATNRDVQLGVFVANHLHLVALQDRGIDARWSAGLSLGEYNHLVHIGALDFVEALRVVDARGRAYDRGPPGCMAAVFPVTVDELKPVLDEVDGFVALSNQNSPTQQVIAGELAAVRESLRLLEERWLGQGVVIEKHIPMHTARFAPVASELAPALEAAAWSTPRGAYLPNVLGSILRDPTAETIVAMLLRHVHQPVQWQRTVETLTARVPDALFIEVGPGTVLHDLLQRPWSRRPRAHTADAIALDAVQEASCAA